MNTDEERLRGKVAEYCALYHVDPPFDLSELYDLVLDWKVNKEFPFARERGCYVFYSEKYEMLYIGKASQRNSLGSRIASYFRWDLCHTIIEPRHSGWTSAPRYVQTIRTHKSFEAPSLEEFLIIELDPVDNTSGLPRRRSVVTQI